MSSSSPKRQGNNQSKSTSLTGRSPSPTNRMSDGYASITLLEVEKESIQTQIIALHL